MLSRQCQWADTRNRHQRIVRTRHHPPTDAWREVTGHRHLRSYELLIDNTCVVVMSAWVRPLVGSGGHNQPVRPALEGSWANRGRADFRRSVCWCWRSGARSGAGRLRS